MTAATAGQAGVPIQAWRAFADLVRRWAVAEFVLPGEPVAWERAGRNSKTGRSYTPEKTRDAENAIAEAFRRACPDWEVDEHSAFGVLLEFHLGHLRGLDGDNMLKLVCDALNGVFWKDDRQAAEYHVRVERGVATEPQTLIVLYPAAENRHSRPRTRRPKAAPADPSPSIDIRRRIYNFLASEAVAGRKPTLTQIGEFAGLTPLKTGDVVRALESGGYLTRSPTRPHNVKFFKPFPRES